MKLNKNNKILTVLMSVMMIIGGLSFTACDSDDDNKGGGSAIVLHTFGPSPALRGGELRFIGKNLDKVTSITIPGTAEISDISVVDVREIRINIPQDSEPGIVILNTSTGTIETKTALTFSEPISIDKVSPLAVKAGDKLTIEGEYLNLIEEVIFAGDSIVTEFVSQSRSKIEVIIPVYAKPGKIRVSNGAEIPIVVYSDDDLDVTLPSFKSVTPNPVKPGEEIVIEGSDFNLVEYFILPGGEKIKGNGENKVTLKTPQSVKEGPVTLVAYCGIEIESDILKLIKPVIESVSSNTVKNGAEFIITGKDLDLVSDISFNSADPVTEFKEIESDKIVLIIPENATNGIYTLNTLSETPVEGGELTFILPGVSEITPDLVKAKEDIKIKGTDLDLVSKVNFGSVTGEIKQSSENELTVTVPVGAETGALTLITTNASQVITTQTVTINVTLPTINSIKSEGIGNKITIEGSDLSLIKEIYFADKDGRYTISCVAYGAKSDALVEFYHVKGSATGPITPMMITIDGDEGLMPIVFCGGADPVASDASIYFDFEAGSYPGNIWGIGTIETDAKGNSYYRGGSGIILDSEFKWFFADNNNGRDIIEDISNKVLKIDIKADEDFIPGDYKIQWIFGGSWGWCTSGHFPVDENGVFSTGGEWMTLTLEFETLGISAIGSGDSGLACQLSNFDWSKICIDNVRIENKK